MGQILRCPECLDHFEDGLEGIALPPQHMIYNSACHAMQKLVIRAEDLRLQDIVSSHFVGIPCADGE
jgi:hypothetical protein